MQNRKKMISRSEYYLFIFKTSDLELVSRASLGNLRICKPTVFLFYNMHLLHIEKFLLNHSSIIDRKPH